MAKTVLNVKTDVEVKTKAQEIARALGIPLSTIVNASLKDLIRTQSITFSIEPQLKTEVAAQLEKASADFKAGRHVTQPLKNEKEMLNYLHT